MPSKGHYEIVFQFLKDDPIKHTFFVLPDMKEEIILGIDFLTKFKTCIDGTARKLTYHSSKGPQNVLMEIDIEEKSDGRKKYKAEGLKFVNLTKDQEQGVYSILCKYDHIFATSLADLGEPKGLPMLRILDNNVPFFRKIYSVPITQRPILDSKIGELLKYNIIEESTSPYSSPVLLIKKKTGGFRLAVDFRTLNKQCLPYPSLIPNISSAFQQLYGAKFFTSVDLFSGFYNLMLDPSTAYKSGFSTPEGHYQFKRVPFGIFSAPGIFCSVMQKVLRPLLRKYVIVYMDDIIIYSRSFDDHLLHIEEVFKHLDRYNLRVNLEKCEFAKFRILFLGFIITQEGMQPNCSKVEAINNIKPPKNVDQLKSFLGITNFFRKFIRSYAHRCHPMLKLLKKKTEWEWGDEQNKSFEDIKKELTSCPILRFPQLDKNFIIMSDASQYGVGAVLGQNQLAFQEKRKKKKGLSLLAMRRKR